MPDNFEEINKYRELYSAFIEQTLRDACRSITEAINDSGAAKMTAYSRVSARKHQQEARVWCLGAGPYSDDPEYKEWRRFVLDSVELDEEKFTRRMEKLAEDGWQDGWMTVAQIEAIKKNIDDDPDFD